MKNLKLVLFFIVMLLVTEAYSNHNYDKILLENLKTFTVFKNRKTKGRRSKVLQMECVEGDACKYFQPHSMQCTQVGFDGYNASWKCEAPLEDYYYIGYTKVSCEGYKNPYDKYITRDSCGVRYSLYLTEKGKEYFHPHRSRSSYHSSSHSSNYARSTHSEDSDDGEASGSSGLVIVLLIIGGFIAYKIYQGWKKNKENNDPPPAYGSWENEDNNNDNNNDNHHNNNNRRNNNNNNNNNNSSSGASRVGDFLSGFMAGNGVRSRNSGNRTTNNYNYYDSNRSSRTRYRSRSRSRSRSPPQTYNAFGFGDTERR